jgi:hypothetical protein
MSFIGKVREMFGFQSKSKAPTNNVGPDVSRAVQRNERAGFAVQEALEEMLSRNDSLRREKK